jgi:hypothetical protein
MSSSRSRPQSQEPDDEQLGLFGSVAKPKASRQPTGSADSSWSPHAELRRLVGELTRTTKLSYGMVNVEINKRLGIRSRTGADLDVIRRAVEVARAWLTGLAAEDSSPPNTESHDRTLSQVPAPSHTAPVTQRPSTSSSPSQRSAPRLRATEEQEAAVEAFLSRQHLALQAGAGTGKTTTLTLLAKADRRRGRYLSFNKSIATDAAQKFPPTVACRTAHSLAYEAVGHSYAQRLRAPRKPAWRAGAALGIAPTMQVRIGDRTVTNKGLSYAVVRTVRRFCQSADTALRPHHVPWLRGLAAEDLHEQLARVVLPYAQKAWADLQDPMGGAMRFEHDHYFKMWAMGRPLIRSDYLLLDEAQDTNPVLEEVFNAQRSHAQLVMVGDSAQAIYGWRGARDVMADFDGEQLALSQSFRFGSALAQEANRWLTVVESPIRLIGAPSLTTTIGPSDNADAILCRTNVGAMIVILRLLADNLRVALVGGGKALEDLAVAAGQLKAGRRASHPELVLFSTWGELQEYAEFDPSGQDLLPLVEIIDEHGADEILAAVRRLSEEHDAQIVVSTAHKAKGREWPCVQIAPDFEPLPGEETDAQGQPIPQPLDLGEARLAYVAVTRARQHLDPGGLAWFDRHPDAPARVDVAPQPPRAPAASPESSNGPVPGASPWDLLGPPPPSY